VTHDPESENDEQLVAVTVVRSGGFAGVTRRWAVTAAPPEAEHWVILVEDCPWDDCGRAATAPGAEAARTAGADRFSWELHAVLPDVDRRAELSETEASGPWRTLIDAVREASAATPAPGTTAPPAAPPAAPAPEATAHPQSEK